MQHAAKSMGHRHVDDPAVRERQSREAGEHGAIGKPNKV